MSGPLPMLTSTHLTPRGAILASALALAALTSTPAHAEILFGLSTFVTGSGQQLVSFDSATPGTLIGQAVTLTGTTSNEALADIDVFPVTGSLIGIGAVTGTLYDINFSTGAVTVNVVPASSVGTPQDIDFNPTADRLRISSAGNANFRLTPTGGNNANLTPGAVAGDGTYAFAAGDSNAGATPSIVGNAYTNSFDGATATSLYSLDSGVNALLLHTGTPSFATLTTVAPLTAGGSGLTLGSNVGFDISAFTSTAYFTNGSALYTLNLTNGQAVSQGNVNPGVTLQSIAVPEPGTAGLVGAGLALTALRRRRK